MVLLSLAGAFGLCILAGLANGETFADQSLQAFATSIGMTFALAALFLLLGRKGQAKLFRREALCVIGLSWILATIVGAIPYLLIVEHCELFPMRSLRVPLGSPPLVRPPSQSFTSSRIVYCFGAHSASGSAA